MLSAFRLTRIPLRYGFCDTKKKHSFGRVARALIILIASRRKSWKLKNKSVLKRRKLNVKKKGKGELPVFPGADQGSFAFYGECSTWADTKEIIHNESFKLPAFSSRSGKTRVKHNDCCIAVRFYSEASLIQAKNCLNITRRVTQNLLNFTLKLPKFSDILSGFWGLFALFIHSHQIFARAKQEKSRRERQKLKLQQFKPKIVPTRRIFADRGLWVRAADRRGADRSRKLITKTVA